MRRSRLVSAMTASLLMFAACGSDDGAGSDQARTIEIDMVDIAFEPDTIDVSTGETVRFVFTNKGAIAHDAFIGDKAAQADHEKEMREGEGDDHGGHGGGHGDDDATAITVGPGETGELTYTFAEPGTIEIGCHQPGHYDAGMRVTIDVD